MKRRRHRFKEYFIGCEFLSHPKHISLENGVKLLSTRNSTTTLDDIYRHYVPRKRVMKKQDVQPEDIEEFDGEVTGFAMQAPLPSGKVGFYEPSHEGKTFEDCSEIVARCALGFR